MQLVPSGVSLTFEVTYSRADLFVAMSIFHITNSGPVLEAQIPMTALMGSNTYYAQFNPDDSQSYVMVKAVYTNGSYGTVDQDYGQGSESIYATTISGGGGSSGGCNLIGTALPNPVLIGQTVPSPVLIGRIEC